MASFLAEMASKTRFRIGRRAWRIQTWIQNHLTQRPRIVQDSCETVSLAIRCDKASHSPEGPKIEKIQDFAPGLKLSSDQSQIEIFNRDWNFQARLKIRLLFWGIIKVGIENFKRDWNFQARLKFSILDWNFQAYGLKISRDHSGLNFFNRRALWENSGMLEGAQTVKCKPWTERVAEKGLSRGDVQSSLKKAHKPWIRGKKGRTNREPCCC